MRINPVKPKGWAGCAQRMLHACANSSYERSTCF